MTESKAEKLLVNADVYYDMTHKLIEYERKEEKYHWRDLRKTPNDLPNDGELVYTFGRLGTKLCYGVMTYNEDNGWIDGVNPPDINNRFVFAWKPLDEFEEV